MIVRTPRGRMATAKAYKHLGKPCKRNDGPDLPQGLLFD
jgi:hypothetical protein